MNNYRNKALEEMFKQKYAKNNVDAELATELHKRSVERYEWNKQIDKAKYEKKLANKGKKLNATS